MITMINVVTASHNTTQTVSRFCGVFPLHDQAKRVPNYANQDTIPHTQNAADDSTMPAAEGVGDKELCWPKLFVTDQL